MTIAEYAEYVGLSQSAVYKQVHQNKLPENVTSQKIGKATYILSVKLEQTRGEYAGKDF